MKNEPTRVTPWPGAASISKRIPYGWFTRQMVADQIGKSRDTIERWEKEDPPFAVPDGYMEFGKLHVPLYSLEAVKDLAVRAKTKRPGRKKADPKPTTTTE